MPSSYQPLMDALEPAVRHHGHEITQELRLLRNGTFQFYDYSDDLAGTPVIEMTQKESQVYSFGRGAMTKVYRISTPLLSVIVDALMQKVKSES